jgi:hypothetical protein
MFGLIALLPGPLSGATFIASTSKLAHYFIGGQSVAVTARFKLCVVGAALRAFALLTARATAGAGRRTETRVAADGSKNGAAASADSHSGQGSLLSVVESGRDSPGTIG